MDKFGVDESVDQSLMEKAAAQGCPNCGGTVRSDGRLAFCAKCGTEPFERKVHGSKEVSKKPGNK